MVRANARVGRLLLEVGERKGDFLLCQVRQMQSHISLGYQFSTKHVHFKDF